MGKRIIQNEKNNLIDYNSVWVWVIDFFVSSCTELPSVGNLICRRPQ